MSKINMKQNLKEISREINDGQALFNEVAIIRNASKILNEDSSQADMIDAILSAVIVDDVRPDKIVVDDASNFDQILQKIASSYHNENFIKNSTRGDLGSGRPDDDYDEEGRNYSEELRSEFVQDNIDNEEKEGVIEMKDGIHDDIVYQQAFNVPGLGKTRHESLHR